MRYYVTDGIGGPTATGSDGNYAYWVAAARKMGQAVARTLAEIESKAEPADLTEEDDAAAMGFVDGPIFCRDGCTPANPCRTPNICPVFAEEQVAKILDHPAFQRDRREWRERHARGLRKWLGDGYECRATEHLMCAPVPLARR